MSSFAGVSSICMNQDDEEEKGHQIELMGEIYTWTSATYIWLGPGDAITDRAMHKLKGGTGRHSRGVRGFSERRSSIPWWLQIFLFDTLDQSFCGLFRWLRYYTWYFLGHWKLSQDELEHLLDCSWVQRLWTFQEFLLSQAPIFICGDKVIPMYSFRFNLGNQTSCIVNSSTLEHWVALCHSWETLARPTQWNYRGVTTQILHVKRFMGSHRHYDSESFAAQVVSLGFLAILRALVLLATVSTIVELWAHGRLSTTVTVVTSTLGGLAFLSFIAEFGFYVFEDSGRLKKSLRLATLQTIRLRQGKEAEDHSYAVHGIMKAAGMNVKPREVNISLATVYSNLFADLLPWTRLNTLLDAGLPNLDLSPTWIPRFDQAAGKQWLHHSYLYEPEYLPISEAKYKAAVNENDLHTAGAFFDIIIYKTGSLNASSVAGGCASEAQDIASELSVWLQYFQRAQLNSDTLHSRNGIDQCLMQVIYACPFREISEEQVADFDKWFRILARHRHRVFKENHARDCAKDIKQEPNVLEIHQKMCNMFTGQRIYFVTRTGHVGTASPYVQLGDKVAVIPTVAMPMILRPADGGKFQVVGPSFICGMMDGERRETDVVEDIVLC